VTTPPSPRRRRRLVIAGAAGVLALIAPATIASAHTETDFVAVPAGSAATVTFEPEHGCGDSPTIDMRVQSPVAGATAVERDGWTATTTPNADGTTVLQWSGGSQPADEAGAFQVRFPVPDTVGSLLAFPAVQLCADGEQEAWIETAADAESPAPQLLVLAAGSPPAATLDDVPADAPGRDLLVAALAGDAVDDSGAAPATTEQATTAPSTTAAASTTTSAGTTTAASTTTATPTSTAAPSTAAPTTAAAGSTTTAPSSGDGGSSTGWIVALVIAAVVIVVAVVAVVLRRRGGAPD
jgi:uncharacterized protein YcnI